MIVFGMDTSGPTASVCVMQAQGQEQRVLFEHRLDEGLTHSQTMLPLVERAFAQTGLQPNKVDLFAVAAGPGSFTGLRIGLALAKGLAMPANVPVGPVSTLLALALASEEKGIVIPALDARRGEVYWGAFLCDAAGCHRLLEDTAGPAEQIDAYLINRQGNNEPVFAVGEGGKLWYNVGNFKLNVKPAQRLTRRPIAYGAALAAFYMAQQGRLVLAKEANPVYLRLSQAQRQRLEREGEKNM